MHMHTHTEEILHLRMLFLINVQLTLYGEGRGLLYNYLSKQVAQPQRQQVFE